MISRLHIRRTDKSSEAAFHNIEEYMPHVEEFYKIYELQHGMDNVERRIYLASDEPKVFAEAKQKYPSYRFINDDRNAQKASLSKRYTPDSAKGVVLDIYFLSQCDFVVCTFSSQICRLVYELMQTRYSDGSWRFKSLDDVYFFGGQRPHNVLAVFDHSPLYSYEIEMKKGDLIGLAGNHWNGYSKGTNVRTKRSGLFPSYKVINVVEIF